MRDKLLESMIKIDLNRLDQTGQLAYQRTLQVILSRFGRPDETVVNQLVSKIDPLFPSDSAEMNWLLCETLAWLESPHIATESNCHDSICSNSRGADAVCKIDSISQKRLDGST